MPHSLRARLSGLRYKKIISDKDYDRLCKALDNENALDKIRAEIQQLPTNTRINWDGCCPDISYPQIEYVDITKNELLSIIDKYKKGR